MTSDEALMVQFRGGSREAFDELFARYRELVYGFFRRRLPDRTRAEDLTQETFLAVLKASERYEPRSPVRSYLFGIAYKLLGAEHRKAGREMPASELANADAADASIWVRQALAKLDGGEREILMLREYEQLNY